MYNSAPNLYTSVASHNTKVTPSAQTMQFRREFCSDRYKQGRDEDQDFQEQLREVEMTEVEMNVDQTEREKERVRDSGLYQTVTLICKSFLSLSSL
jgi:hypothetical protein